MRQALIDFGAADHLSLLHGAHNSMLALVTTEFEWREHLLSKQDAIQKAVGLEYAKAANCYISQNPFKPYQRRLISHISCLANAFVDLDTYNVPNLEGLEKEQILDKILSENPDMPCPTMFADSGRGMYLIWTFEKTKPASFLPAWQEIENNLIRLLKRYGADSKCSDSARVLRIAHTENSKANSQARYYPLSKPIRFEDLQKFSNKLTRQYRESLPKQARRSGNVTILRTGLVAKNAYSLAYARMNDIKKLAELRGGKLTDLRKTAIFYYAACASWYLNDLDTLKNELEGFILDYIDNPQAYLKKRPVTVYRRYEQSQEGITITFMGKEYDARYRFRNQTLLAGLEVTEAEQEQLSCIISKQEKYRRKNEKRLQAARAKGRQSRLDYEKAARTRLQKALELDSKGFRPSDIAKELGVSRMTAYRYLEKCNK